MSEVATKLGQLQGDIQRRWVDVFAPVLFMTKHKSDLMPVMRLHKSNIFGGMLDDPGIANAMTKMYPPGPKFAEFMSSHIESTALKDLDHLADVALDSALVFGHAILDDALFQCLRIGYGVRPEFYWKKVSQRKVSLEKLAEQDVPSIRDEAVDSWLAAIERESINAKFQALLQMTTPTSMDLLEDFKFDLPKLDEIDNLRHSLVHKTKLRSVTFADLEYLSRASAFGPALLMHAGAPMSVQGMLNALGVNYSLPKDIIHTIEPTYTASSKQGEASDR